jgi:hypothetical protein
MSPRSTTTTVLTLALGASVPLTVMGGIGEAHRLPAGTRTAFELIATKSDRKKALRHQAERQQDGNQSHLKTIWRSSHSAAPAGLAEDCSRESPIHA